MRNGKMADLISDIHEQREKKATLYFKVSSFPHLRVEDFAGGVRLKMEMDTKEPNPSQIKRPLIVVEINKKRKLQAEQFCLPSSKHPCWKPLTLGSIAEVEGFSPCTFKAKGGNVYDSDTAMSMHVDAKYLLHNSASSSSPDWGSCAHGSHSYGTSVASTSVEKHVLGDDEPETSVARLAENLEETLAEYGRDVDYIYSGYGNYTMEQYRDKEIEEIFDSDGEDSNVYVASSEQWSVNQEAPQTKRKPTIDQEFEQYFSMLML